MNSLSYIRFPNQEPFSSYLCNDSDSLGPLSLINIFIGPNNSGKSRLLRNLFSLPEYEYISSEYSAGLVREIVEGLKTEFDKVFEHNITAVGRISSNHLDQILNYDENFINPKNPIDQLIETQLTEMTNADGSRVESRGGMAHRADGNQLAEQLRKLGRLGLEKLEGINYDKNIGGDKRFYVPILRGMRPLEENQENLYKDRTIADYFSESPLPDFAEVFTGIELYQTLKEMLLGEPEQRETVARFENFLSNRFFRGRKITLIPREGDTIVHVKIGDETQLPIYQLGDGLQGLIISVFNMFLATSRSIFFLEEPDMCMHPSLQRSLLEVLSEFDQHQYFITTHSNHFLDMALDFSPMSIFHFKKKDKEGPRFEINLASSRDHNILRDLGVRNSSLFLTNATLWVEGITDRLYLRAYMKKYRDELITDDPEIYETIRLLSEDYHYSFVEYQGSNITHWSFDPEDVDAKRIKASYVCGNAFLIADGDITSKGDREEVYKAMLEDRFLILDQKEIENLIPEEILKHLVSNTFQNYSKDVNSIQFEEYSKPDKPLGEYLDSLLDLEDDQSKFSESSGTVKMKVVFCEKAIKIMESSDISWRLSEELRSICERIFNHIIDQNK